MISLIKQCLNKYNSQQNYLLEARMVIGINGAWAAADAMYYLNRIVRYGVTDSRKEVIYNLKQHFIKTLYEKGYCTLVLRHKQCLYCRDCGGMGIEGYGQGDVCERCDGTGVYSSHFLYLFEFCIDGVIYKWHQPASQVGWFWGEFTDDPKEFHGHHPEDYAVPDSDMIATSIARVYIYLKQHGVADSDLLVTTYGFRQIVSEIWQGLYYSPRMYPVRRRTRSIRNWVAAVKKFLTQPDRQRFDEIPF